MIKYILQLVYLSNSEFNLRLNWFRTKSTCLNKYKKKNIKLENRKVEELKFQFLKRKYIAKSK